MDAVPRGRLPAVQLAAGRLRKCQFNNYGGRTAVSKSAERSRKREFKICPTRAICSDRAALLNEVREARTDPRSGTASSNRLIASRRPSGNTGGKMRTSGDEGKWLGDNYVPAERTARRAETSRRPGQEAPRRCRGRGNRTQDPRVEAATLVADQPRGRHIGRRSSRGRNTRRKPTASPRGDRRDC